MDIERQILRRLSSGGRKVLDVKTLSVPPSDSMFDPDPNGVYRYIELRIDSLRDGEEFTSPSARTNSAKRYIGMVTQIDQTNVLYLLNIQNSCPTVTKMDLTQVAGYTLFPGQIVKLQGKNRLGNEILVYEIDYLTQVEILPPPLHREAFKLSVLNLDKALGKLAPTAAQEEVPALAQLLARYGSSDVLVILGDLAPSEREYCKEWSKKKTLTVAVPSHTSANSTMVYPTHFTTTISSQPPATSKPYLFPVTNTFVEVSNPSILYINGISIGVSGLDTVFGVLSLEAGKGVEDRVHTSLTHAVFQKTFLPFIPKNTPIDYTLGEHLVHPHILDVLIIATSIKTPPLYIDATYVLPLSTETHTLAITPTDEQAVRSVAE
ncbi:DNA polymerase alpha subunit B [Nematocida displodere]|uniref:DNA polymerase alpha subunit B n=1 Tax=Nematocida displodere TaxID=1805483 RepID=A0A177EFM7_9MICR|nr:DNA polymerase alpha subunit B [Nematocida displodere]